jgi:hypothetical protein
MDPGHAYVFAKSGSADRHAGPGSLHTVRMAKHNAWNLCIAAAAPKCVSSLQSGPRYRWTWRQGRFYGCNTRCYTGPTAPAVRCLLGPTSSATSTQTHDAWCAIDAARGGDIPPRPAHGPDHLSLPPSRLRVAMHPPPQHVGMYIHGSTGARGASSSTDDVPRRQSADSAQHHGDECPPAFAPPSRV